MLTSQNTCPDNAHGILTSTHAYECDTQVSSDRLRSRTTPLAGREAGDRPRALVRQAAPNPTQSDGIRVKVSPVVMEGN